MKKTIYKVLIMTVLAGTTACTDILDTAPYNSVASGNMWTNEALTNQGVAGVYEAMRSWGVYGASSYGIPVVPFECLGFSGEAYRSIAYLEWRRRSRRHVFQHNVEQVLRGRSPRQRCHRSST